MTSHPVSDATAKKSALLVGGVLLAIAAWNVYRDRPGVYFTLGAVGCVLLLIGAFSPRASQAFHHGWMKFAAVLGYVNSRILLSLMFFVVMTPMGVLGRLFGRNPLNRRGATQQTYWIPRARPRQPRGQFERLF